LLPAGAKIAGWDSHPLENAALARRTPTLAIQPKSLDGNYVLKVAVYYPGADQQKSTLKHHPCRMTEW